MKRADVLNLIRLGESREDALERMKRKEDRRKENVKRNIEEVDFWGRPMRTRMKKVSA